MPEVSLLEFFLKPAIVVKFYETTFIVSRFVDLCDLCEFGFILNHCCSFQIDLIIPLWNSLISKGYNSG